MIGLHVRKLCFSALAHFAQVRTFQNMKVLLNTFPSIPHSKWSDYTCARCVLYALAHFAYVHTFQNMKVLWNTFPSISLSKWSIYLRASCAICAHAHLVPFLLFARWLTLRTFMTSKIGKYSSIPSHRYHRLEMIPTRMRIFPPLCACALRAISYAIEYQSTIRYLSNDTALGKFGTQLLTVEYLREFHFSQKRQVRHLKTDLEVSNFLHVFF